MTLLAIVLFAAILVTLGVALAALLGSRDRSRTLVTALTLRVGLSVLFFLLLLAAWYAGLIAPHALGGH